MKNRKLIKRVKHKKQLRKASLPNTCGNNLLQNRMKITVDDSRYQYNDWRHIYLKNHPEPQRMLPNHSTIEIDGIGRRNSDLQANR